MANPTNAELQAQLTDATKRAAAAEERAAKLTTAHDAIAERLAAEAAAHGALKQAHGTLEDEHRALGASLKAYKGSATRAKREATVLKAALSPEARPIGAMKPPRNEAEAAARAEALEAAFARDTTQLVFSDGRREIRELAPLVITGDAWRVTVPQSATEIGRVLNAEPLLEPGDCQRQQFELKGFGLLNEAGEQVAYQALPDAITIAPNTRVQLPLNMVRF